MTYLQILRRSLIFMIAIIFFFELKGQGIYAKTLAARLGAVVEYMAEMAAAFGANRFNSLQSVALIRFFDNIAFLNGLIKTGPARAAVIFGAGRK